MLQTPAQLAFQHVFLSTSKGLLWALFLAFLIGAGIQVNSLMADLNASPPAQWQLMPWETALAWLGKTVALGIFVALLLGVPAVAGALLRLWPMTRLFRHYMENRQASATRFALLIFVFFEATVALAAVLSFGIKETELLWRLAFCQAASLPWLCSSLWVGWQLLLAERRRQVSDEEAGHLPPGRNQPA